MSDDIVKSNGITDTVGVTIEGNGNVFKFNTLIEDAKVDVGSPNEKNLGIMLDGFK